MKIMVGSILLIVLVGCSENDSTETFNNMNTDKDMPTPKSKITNKNPNEVLAPQTCYYSCKARK